jgi:hypothetical protein
MRAATSNVTAWPDEIDQILAGDLTAALAYMTPAGGSVVTAVAPIGLRDREAGSVSFTTSLGFGRKLDRIEKNPKVSLAYHAREHGFAAGNGRFVLVQGNACFDAKPEQDVLEHRIGPQSQRFMGKPRRGRFWDRWLREYYSDRVIVTVDVERIVAWPDLHCAGEPQTHGASIDARTPAPQQAPAKGSGPRLDSVRSAKRLAALDHTLLAYGGADGFPTVVPVTVEGAGGDGVKLASECALPAGGRRAGLLSHSYRAQLIGLAARQHTGWLEVGEANTRRASYAPHTESGFKAPANKTLLLLANGLLAKRGLRNARKAGRAPAS